MRSFKRILLPLIIVVLLITSAMMLFALTYSGEVQELIKNKVSRNFTSPILIKNIRISPFRKFPRISIVIDETVIYEDPSFGNKKLARIDKIYLAVDLFSLLKKNIELEKVMIEGGEIYLRSDSLNHFNYNILNENEEVEDENIRFDLQKIVLNDIKLSYRNIQGIHFADIKVTQADAKMKKLDDLFSFEIDMNVLSDSVGTGNKAFLKNKELDAKLDVEFDTESMEISILSSSVYFEEILMEAHGICKIPGNKPIYADVNFALNEVPLKSINAFIPEDYQDTLKYFDIKGAFNVKGSIKGVYDSLSFPSANIAFSIKEGEVRHDKSRLLIEDIALNGHLTGQKKEGKLVSDLVIEKFESIIDGRNLEINGKIKNISDPVFTFLIKSDMNAESFMKLYPVKAIREMAGHTSINLNVSGKLNELFDKNFSNLKIKGRAEMNGVQFTLTDYDYLSFSKCSATLLFNGTDKIQLTECIARTDKSRIKVKAEVSDFLKYFSDSTTSLNIIARIEGNMLDVDELLGDYVEEEDESGEGHFNYKIFFPKRIKAEAFCDLKHVRYDGVYYDAVTGLVYLDNGQYDFDRINVTAFNGKTSVTGLLSLDKKELIVLDAVLRITGMDISSAFREMDNFNQNYITDKHIKGKLSGKIQLSMAFTRELDIDEKRLFAISDIIVDQANLSNFKPLMDLMGFVKMKKLKDIDFDRIENTIMIKDRIITIPTMDLKNSAFNISMSGTHTFDNIIDYKLKINLTELFFKRYNQSKSEFQNSTDDKQGGMIMYARMTGDVDHIKFQMDRESVKENVQENLKQEKEEFLQIFKKKQEEHEEFEWGWEDE